MCGCLCVCVRMLRATLAVPLEPSPCFGRQGLSLALFTDWCVLCVQLSLGIFLPLPPQYWYCKNTLCSVFIVGAGDGSQVPYALWQTLHLWSHLPS